MDAVPSLLSVQIDILGTKSDITECLEKLCTPCGDPPIVGATIVSMLKPVDMKTFHEYAKLIFLPYIKSNLRNAIRVDVIWAVYLPAYQEHIPLLDDSINVNVVWNIMPA